MVCGKMFEINYKKMFSQFVFIVAIQTLYASAKLSVLIVLIVVIKKVN